MRTKLYFDGGCRPNPGPIETAVVVGGVAHIRDDGAVGDHNLAEWTALLRAADLAVAMGLSDVLFLGDSALVVGQAGGTARCRTAEFAACRARFLAATAPLSRVAVRHVPRAKNLAGIVLQRRRDRPDELRLSRSAGVA